MYRASNTQAFLKRIFGQPPALMPFATLDCDVAFSKANIGLGQLHDEMGCH